jgi:thymidylate synthase
MSNADEVYLSLLQDVLNNGVKSDDRTGVGTRSVFGRQVRYDLSQSFPLLTTKKMFFRGVFEELKWFISGSTNYKDLPENVQKWWSPWADEDGNLGPIYGHQLRNQQSFCEIDKPKTYEPDQNWVSDPTVFGVGKILNPKKTWNNTQDDLILKPIWRDMLRRCYYDRCKSYKSYGAKGVHVDSRWFIYEQFKADAIKLPRWHLKKEYPELYSLDKDVLHRSNRYGPETCLWASKEEQSWNTSTNTPFYATSPEGIKCVFTSLGQAHKEHGLNISALHRCLNGKLKSHHGWTDFAYTSSKSFIQMDQLRNSIALIKHDPNSRRNVINLWETSSMFTDAKLPCCHGSVIQFYVREGVLSCHMYQRSADVFIGIPVNVASYALLTEMVAHVTGLQTGEFIHAFGDLHLYNNHEEQAKEQLSRHPKEPPQLNLNKKVESIFDFEYSDLELVGYNPHPAIKAPVAV